MYGVLRCWYKSLGIGGRDLLVSDDGMENHIIVNHSVWCVKVLVQELGDGAFCFELFISLAMEYI